MEKQHFTTTYSVYKTDETLDSTDKALLTAARAATAAAYAPYSNFRVAAVAQLSNGMCIQGTNQENASYPVGICAERVLLAAVASQYPAAVIETMAISYHNIHGHSDKPVSPCGMCRQALLEFEGRQRQPIRLILGGMQGQVYIVEEAGALLPLHFGSDYLK